MAKTRKTHKQVCRYLANAKLMRNLTPHSKNWTPQVIKLEACIACPVLGKDCPPGCQYL